VAARESLMSFGLGSMLGMMGSVPVVKSADIIFNKLKAAKTLEAGNIGDIMKETMGQGLKGLLQNPMQKSGGQAKQATEAASSQIPMKDYPMTFQAIKGLESAINSTMTVAADLVGIGKDPQNLLYSVATTNTLETLGSNEPLYSPTTLLKPAVSDKEMDIITSEMPRIVDALLAGALTDAEANDQIAALNFMLTIIVVQSKEAKRIADAYAVYLSSVAAAGALLNSHIPEWREIMAKAFMDDIYPRVKAANDEFMSID
jgi:hypothetical protein